MTHGQFTDYRARPALTVSDDGHGTATIPALEGQIKVRGGGEGAAVAADLPTRPNEGVHPHIREMPASTAAGLIEAAADSPGAFEATANVPAILHNNKGDFRAAMQYLRSLEPERSDRRAGEPAMSPEPPARAAKRLRGNQSPGWTVKSAVQRQSALGSLCQPSNAHPKRVYTTFGHRQKQHGETGRKAHQFRTPLPSPYPIRVHPRIGSGGIPIRIETRLIPFRLRTGGWRRP